MTRVRLGLLPVLGLLALAPVALFATGRPALGAGALSAVSVVLIAASLYLMFSPSESEPPAAAEG